MSEERAPYRAVKARVEGPGHLCCQDPDCWLPLAVRHQTVAELRAAGVRSAVVVCARCGQVLRVEPIGPDAALGREMVSVPGDGGAFLVDHAAWFLVLAQQRLDGLSLEAKRTGMEGTRNV